MSWTPHGRHLIAGEWVAGETTFASTPAKGPSHEFAVGTPALVARACEAAEDAFWTYGYTSREERALFLEGIADEIEARAAAITEIGTQETGLPTGRLEGERGRTTGQLRLFSNHIRKADYLDRRVDEALPDRKPAPRPEIRLMQRPIGPVAVFGASNFPLAFSTAGGDTAAALAAGCPVVVKGHSAHPGTGEIIAEAIHAAIAKTGMPKGVFSLIQGGDRKVGEALVTHSLIKAVGFTGSLGGGRALFNLCAQRPEPIPFFGELGSVNPMFLLPEVMKTRAPSLGEGWAASLTMGAGQFCTNPGIAVVIDGSDADSFVQSTRSALEKVAPQVMLTDSIAKAYQDGKAHFDSRNSIKPVLTTESRGREASSNLYETTGEAFLGDHTIGEEVFGPLGVVVRVKSVDDMVHLAKGFEGQLTATLHMDKDDAASARKLLPVLERKAGRVLANGFPTGVEVVDSMVHGGPYPASTNFGATSVGTMSIRRFLRPVSYQNIPADVLPADLV
ncbi:aldehyde dehydrogenase (NADP(+)) [Brucella sp. 2280]|uniref:aldehyde dehydrogenase (NADP(+)) n=1 Tax=Brucella sp. 2280 TaxID=2592625 RepID=UPI001294B422|nr:aldehyde dehydrogenase (NADP(+)) [Brucella sp. 2280]QGA57828.1 aldehyde dehydrogenase family protein [Brucella sp. 2280]